MRNIVLGLGISLDGYIARLNGAVDFLFMPKDFSMAAFFKTIDATILGRKPWMTRSKWEARLTLRCPPTCSRGRSRQASGTVLPTSANHPRRWFANFEKKAGKDIWLMGGGELARDFLKADLVDGLYLGVIPTLLGEGRPLFPAGFPQRDFALVKNETYSRGLIALTYRRVRTKKK